MANTSEQKRSRAPSHPHAKPSIWEHVAAAAGGAIALATIGFMVYEAMTTPTDAVPHLTVQVDTIVSYPHGHVVEFRAVNGGDATAANVQIRGQLKADPGASETSESTVDFVPARSWRHGGLIFKAAPARDRLELRVVGYDRP